MISFEQIQMFTGEQKPLGPKQVVYIYRNMKDPAKLDYREMLMSQVKAQFGDVTLNDLLQVERLTRIFTEPAE